MLVLPRVRVRDVSFIFKRKQKIDSHRISVKYITVFVRLKKLFLNIVFTHSSECRKYLSSECRRFCFHKNKAGILSFSEK